MFDPGFAGFRARGKEDAGAADGGADPLGVLDRCGLCSSAGRNAWESGFGKVDCVLATGTPGPCSHMVVGDGSVAVAAVLPGSASIQVVTFIEDKLGGFKMTRGACSPNLTPLRLVFLPCGGHDVMHPFVNPCGGESQDGLWAKMGKEVSYWGFRVHRVRDASLGGAQAGEGAGGQRVRRGVPRPAAAHHQRACSGAPRGGGMVSQPAWMLWRRCLQG